MITNQNCTCVGDPVIDIVDDYDLYSRDNTTWQFMCKVGCASHPELYDVQKVEWNKNIIFVENRNVNKRNRIDWYVFYSPLKPIKCCQRNEILGPISKREVEAFKEKKGIENLKVINPHSE